MARQLTAWNKAVQKQFKAGKAMDVNYSFKQALLDASKMHTSGGNGDGNKDGTEDGTGNGDEDNVNSLNQNGGSEPVGTPVGGSDLVGTPLNASITSTLKHTTGGRRSKKNKSKLHKKKKGGKSHKSRKSHKKPKHH